MLKRKIAALLSFSMALSMFAQTTAFATEPLQTAQDSVVSHEMQAEQVQEKADEAVTQSQETPHKTEQEQPAEIEGTQVTQQQDVIETEQSVQQQHLGAVKVQIDAALTTAKSTTFHVLLKGPKTMEKDLVLLPSDGYKIVSVSNIFADLPKGTYTLVITGQGFARYEQQIQVEDLMYDVQLYTGTLAGYQYAQNEKHPGLLIAGDANGNGKIDAADVSMLVNGIENASKDAALDFNGNGMADLGDLQILAFTYQKNLDTQAFITKSISPKQAQPAVSEGTKVQSGSLENLQNGVKEGVSLATNQGTISPENPVALSFDFKEKPVAMEGLQLNVPVGEGNEVTEASFEVIYQDGETEKTIQIPYTSQEVFFLTQGGSVTRLPDGTLSVDFGGQIAVKKVTFQLNKTKKSTNLAEISSVEFVNDMESRIPAPKMDIPTDVRVEVGNKEFTVAWNPTTNVTGYEVSVSLDGKEEVHRTTSTLFNVSQFDGKELVNNKNYEVRVQSFNGEWRSGYSQPIMATPKPSSVPPAPDRLSLTAGAASIEARWKSMEDTDFYQLYYRKKGDPDFTKVENIKTNQYTINGLEKQTAYEVYVTGVNELGEGPKSILSEVTTKSVVPAKLPNYYLLNTSNGEGVLSNKIKTATHNKGTMVSSPLDANNTKTALGVFDNNYDSYYLVNDWDDGATYPNQNGIVIELNQKEKIGMISLARYEDGGYYGVTRVYAKDENGKEFQIPNVTIGQHTDENGRQFYLIKIPNGIETDWLRVHVGHTYWYKDISIAEMRLHRYDSIEDDIMALYADDLHVTLKPEVTEETLKALEARLEVKDAGELHPDYALLKREIDNAREILNQVKLGEAVYIDNSIVPRRDANKGFRGLNPWQPLGVTAKAGDRIIIYVGGNGAKTGDNTPLQIVTTQYHSESGNVSKVLGTLKVGRNELTIPELHTLSAEKGGALYVQYASNSSYNPNMKYALRVDGGEKIPVLRLRGITEEAERQARITAYVKELKKHVDMINAKQIDDIKNAVINTTDLVFDHMMLSLPASQVLAGLQGTEQEQTARLNSTAKAMDQLMVLFYQHKGISDLQGTSELDHIPYQPLNIRYQRMFAGAFMYAAGDHIGIEWDSVPGTMSGEPVQLDEKGRYISGSLFGWGIAHEIGHQINQSAYEIAEITNNYFSQIAMIGQNKKPRFDYKDVYEKVTSNTIGHAKSVFTQLAMYWQLHLAYDKGYEYEIYKDYQTMLDSRFFARVDTYARDISKAPGDKVKLTLTEDKDQNLMRLASAAAQKDLTDFFTRWGMVITQDTAAYMKQFEPETRALYYTDDASRDYRFEHEKEQAALGFEKKDVLADTISAKIGTQPNQVNFTFALNDTADEAALLGYEITRVIYEGGEKQRQVVGFSTEKTFTDTINTLNNRTVMYEIVAVDRFMNRSNIKTLPALKISHDGSHKKSDWTVSTNLKSAEDVIPPSTEEDPDAPAMVSAIQKVLDNDANTTFTGIAQEEKSVITLDFNQHLPVTAIKYTLSNPEHAMKKALVEISTNGSDWTALKEVSFALDSKTNSATVYFPNKDGKWIETYDALMLRLTIDTPKDTKIAVSELDVLGPTGDNVELDADQIGVLKDAYVYDKNTNASIPAGSTVFMGTYKGNPAYNVVTLFDEEGNIVSSQDEQGNALANQIILADVPENGALGETSNGLWVYWIEPTSKMTLPKSVRAELYRVNDATTNEGQRLVSDTLLVPVPEELPSITIKP